MKKSCLITNSGINQNTGGGIVSYNLLKALQQCTDVQFAFSNQKFPENKFIIDCCTTSNYSPSKEIKSYSINPADYNYKADPFSMDYLAYHILPDELIDIVQTYGCPFGLTVEELKRKGAKIVADVAPHNIELSKEGHLKAGYSYDYPHLTEDMLWGLYSRNLRDSDTVIVHSRTSADYIVKKARLNKYPEIIPHGCYLPDKIEDYPIQFRPGYFGWLSPDKGTDYLLQAWQSYVSDPNIITKTPDFKITQMWLGGTGSMKGRLSEKPSSYFNVVGAVENISDFYNKISIYIQPCYSEDTRLMTEHGLKTIYDIKVSDKVWTLGKERKLELNRINKIYINSYDGMMVKIENKQLNQLITPNHRVYYYSQKYLSTLKVREARELLDKNVVIYIPTTGIWNIDFYLELGNSHGFDADESKGTISFREIKGKNGKAKNMKEYIDIDIFLEFLGWYIAEGHIARRNNGKYTDISIYDKKNQKHVYNLFKKLGLNPLIDNNEVKCYSLQLCDILDECGRGARNKKIPKKYLHFNKDNLMYLYKGLMNGDGSRKGHHVLYYTASDKLKDDFIELCLKLGFSTKTWKRKTKAHIIKKTGQHIGEFEGWMISIREKHNKGTVKTIEHVSLKEYHGDVWCVETKNKNLLVERNGLLSFSGNSITEGFGITPLEAMAHARPVIVTEATGVADLITDGREGFVIPIRNADAIKDKINYFKENPNEITRMGAEARKTAEKYTWDKIKERYVSIWLKM